MGADDEQGRKLEDASWKQKAPKPKTNNQKNPEL
jgi:hypothetical protein